MTRVLLDQAIETDYGQFDLVWNGGFGFEGDWDRVFAGQANGLAGAAHTDGLYLNLGRRSGGSQVRVELCDDKLAATEEWEDVVEVSVVVGNEPGWTTWAGESNGRLDIVAGTYRVRVSAKGRDQGAADEFATRSWTSTWCSFGRARRTRTR